MSLAPAAHPISKRNGGRRIPFGRECAGRRFCCARTISYNSFFLLLKENIGLIQQRRDFIVPDFGRLRVIF